MSAVIQKAQVGVPLASKKLTVRQRAFAVHLASGKGQSEAYRLAFECPTASATTIASKAYALARQPHVAEHVRITVEQKQSVIIRSSLSDRDRVLNKLRSLVDTATPAHMAQIRAAELLGKAAGLFKDNPEAPSNVPAAELESQLRSRITELLGDDVQGESVRVSTDIDADYIDTTQHDMPTTDTAIQCDVTTE
jgi:hypothetical protein